MPQRRTMLLQRRHRLPSARTRSSASSLCTLGCSSALAQPHGRSTFLGTNRREGVTNSGLHGAQKGLRVGAARRRKRRKKKGMGGGCVGGRWQRLSQMLQVSARGGAYRCSSSAIHTPSADPYSPIAPPKSRLTWRRLLTGTILGSIIGGGAYVGTSDEATISKWAFQAANLVNPVFRLFEPEDAHRLAIWAAAHGLVPRETRPDPDVLELEVWGRSFANPVGLAAGFDKNAEAVEGLLGLGFGFVEVGSVTPVPQEGNPRPRVFRLQEEGAIINRYGFNSEGIVAVAKRLGAQHGKRRLAESTREPPHDSESRLGGKAGPGILGVNLGKNKTSEDAAADYVQGVHTLSQYADYLVINVSSPNTPGLRKLQGRKQLQDLIKKVLAARDEMQWGEAGPPPLLVKIAPDLSKQDLSDIAAVAMTLRLDGLVISNTTTSRPDAVLGLVHADETGGLSGKPLFKMSTDVLRDMYQLTRVGACHRPLPTVGADEVSGEVVIVKSLSYILLLMVPEQGKIPLIGCGGIASGEDAYLKIRAGATLVQLYTAFAYEGPSMLPRIKAELAACLERDGFKSVQDAVGADHHS